MHLWGGGPAWGRNPGNLSYAEGTVSQKAGTQRGKDRPDHGLPPLRRPHFLGLASGHWEPTGAGTGDDSGSRSWMAGADRQMDHQPREDLRGAFSWAVWRHH